MTPPPLRLEKLAGAAIRPALPALSRLRTAVFRAWPYLYEAGEADEAEHLASFEQAEGAAFILAMAGGEVVGAATCQPLARALPLMQAPFRDRGMDPARWCYFGESVLLPGYRGQGLGVRFFEAREAHARSLGLREATFCGVVRNPSDPRCPSGYVPLDAFWQKRGYQRRPELTCLYRWREVGDDRETPHTMVFWTRAL